MAVRGTLKQFWYNQPSSTMCHAARRPWVPCLFDAVREHLEGDSSGHDSWHVFRVRELATKIATTVGADVEVVEAAALLHDIGHATGREEHARRGASLAAEILSQCCFPTEKIDAVARCIEFHHWQPGRAGDPPNPTIEYQAFADADRLDALGAIGIARVFAFGGAHHRPIWNPDAGASTLEQYGTSSVHHFYDKLLRLPDDMYTEPGRQLARQRVATMEEFLRSFYAEWTAQDADAIGAAPISLSTLAQGAVDIGDRRRHIAATVLQPNPTT